jgi:hypothetical protein
VLTEALSLADKTGARWHEPELYRLKGDLLLHQSSDNATEAESCFHHALEIAHNQQAKSFEAHPRVTKVFHTGHDLLTAPG